MERKFKILYVSLLVVSWSDFSTGFLGRPIRFRPRKCPTGIGRIRILNWPNRRCDRIPLTPRPKLVTTKKPKTLVTLQPILADPVLPSYPSTSIPYCKSSLTAKDVKAILARRRTKREVDAWPFHCGHASILKIAGKYEFNKQIYDCCVECSFPAFPNCVKNRKNKNLPNWVCPSEGLHCIVGCVNKYKPVTRIETAEMKAVVSSDKLHIAKMRRLTPGQRVIKPVTNRCEKLDMENGNQCIRKLCIPLKLAP